MKSSIFFASLVATFGLSACDRPTAVTTPPATPVIVPGPAGPQDPTGVKGDAGKAGLQGSEGAQGQAGKSGGETVIVVPAPSEQK